jgi:site-specific DNA-methyltransferase (adenine-specific)
MRTQAIFSKKSDDWSTPEKVYDALNQEFDFDFDPCPLQSTEKLGLLERWGRRVFCNPPYSNIENFLEKGLIEMENGNTDVIVYLLPSRTGTKWFHRLVKDKAEIRWIRGRLKFGGSKINAPFDSMIAIYRRK